jgi:hypothetical protein
MTRGTAQWRLLRPTMSVMHQTQKPNKQKSQRPKVTTQPASTTQKARGRDKRGDFRNGGSSGRKDFRGEYFWYPLLQKVRECQSVSQSGVACVSYESSDGIFAQMMIFKVVLQYCLCRIPVLSKKMRSFHRSLCCLLVHFLPS